MKNDEYATLNVALKMHKLKYFDFSDKSYLKKDFLKFNKNDFVGTHYMLNKKCPMCNLVYAPKLFDAQRWLLSNYGLFASAVKRNNQFFPIIYDTNGRFNPFGYKNFKLSVVSIPFKNYHMALNNAINQLINLI